MKPILKSYTKTVCSNKSEIELLDNFANEKKCNTAENTARKVENQSCTLKWIEKFTDSEGLDVIVAHRQKKESGEVVEIILKNSAQREYRAEANRILKINND